MRSLAKIFIALTGIFHILFFKMESIDFMKPEVFERFGLTLESASYVRIWAFNQGFYNCLLYTSPSPRDKRQSRMPSSA